MENLQIHGEVQADFRRKVFSWTIANFIPNLDDKKFSGIISSERLGTSGVIFELDTHLWDNELVSENLTLKLAKANGHQTGFLKMAAWILDQHGKKFELNIDYNDGAGRTLASVNIDKSVIVKNASKLIQKGKITFGCELTNCSQEEYRFEMRKPRLQNLGAKMKTSWNDETLADVSLICGSEEIRTSRFILSLRSKVFYAMFNMNSAEKTTGRIIIRDFSAATMKSFVKFLCTDHVEDDEVTPELLCAADKYDVELLFFVCESRMVKKANSGNAIKFYQLATRLNAKELKNKTAKLIFEHSRFFKLRGEMKLLTKDDTEEIMMIASDFFCI